MRGVVFLGNRKLELRTFPDPTPGPDQVVIQIKASGMCGSDLAPFRASQSPIALVNAGIRRARHRGWGAVLKRARDRLHGNAGPFIRGHEPCGVIAARGSALSDAESPIGQSVLVHHYSGCGQCKHCRAGYTQQCLRGQPIVYGWEAHGGHAPYMLLDRRAVVPMPEGLSFEEGAALGCGSGTAYAGVARIDLHAGETVAIHGAGPVGLSATIFASNLGARVIAIDFSESRLRLAKELGATGLINAREVDSVQAVRDLTNGEGADASIDCTGLPKGRVATLQTTRYFGRAAFLGEGNPTTFDISRDFLRRQITVHGSHTMSTGQLAESARLVVERGLPLRRILTHSFRLEDAQSAYNLFDKQTIGKGYFVT